MKKEENKRKQTNNKKKQKESYNISAINEEEPNSNFGPKASIYSSVRNSCEVNDMNDSN